MHLRILVLFCLLFAFAACDKRETAQSRAGPEASTQALRDACDLLTKEEVQAVVGSLINETKTSSHPDQGLAMSHCFYTAAEFTRSVSLMTTRSDSRGPTKQTPKKFWQERFGQEKASAREGEEEKRAAPPRKIDGLGDEAYWTERVSATLYVLKGDAFIRISVGGPDDEETKLNKSKALAGKVLGRL